jgi:single-strand DNA-binding protein
MNNWNGIGRLTKDSSLTFAPGSGTAVCKFSIAVDRDFKNKDGQKEADFINCIIFNKSAEALSPYLTKGKLVGISGRIQTGNYSNKDNVKIYTTDIIVEKTKFLDSKNSGQAATQNNSNNNVDYGDDMQAVDDGDIPF